MKATMWKGQIIPGDTDAEEECNSEQPIHASIYKYFYCVALRKLQAFFMSATYSVVIVCDLNVIPRLVLGFHGFGGGPMPW